MASLCQRHYEPILDYPQLYGNCSLMAKYLSEDVYSKLRDVKTSSGYTLNNLIQNGVENPDFQIGVLAGDEDSYEVFQAILNPVIRDYHNGYKNDGIHVTDLDYSKVIPDVLDSNYVISTRVRAARNVRGYSLPPIITRAERSTILKLFSSVLARLDGDFVGNCYPLQDMLETTQQQLINDHFLFDKPINRHFMSGGIARDFPDGRAIWYNCKKNFLVWINEEDHVRIISMENGGNVKRVFKRFSDGLLEIEKLVRNNGNELMWNNHLGYIAACPTNLGTGLRCSVHVRLPNLAKSEDQLDKVCYNLRLQKRGLYGECTSSPTSVFDISNVDRLGSSEVDQVNCVIRGVRIIIAIEKQLENGGNNDDLIESVLLNQLTINSV